MVERRQTCAWDNKPQQFEKYLLLFLHIFLTYKKWRPSSLFIISSSSVQLSATFSVPLTAITHFKQQFCQNSKQ